jgi:hypothetical protein
MALVIEFDASGAVLSSTAHGPKAMDPSAMHGAGYVTIP